MKKTITTLLKERKISIGVIGLGYVGLPLSILFAKKNFKLIGFDLDKKKIKFINKGISYIDRISHKEIKNLKKNNFFTSKFDQIKNCDFIIICVPTPLNKKLEPDCSFIEKTFSLIKDKLRVGQTIILESTSYPGTTRELILNKLNKKFKVGDNFFVGFSPERINPGFNEKNIHLTPKVVSGSTKNCTDVVSNFYKKFFSKIHICKDLETAEFSKLLENVYRSVNIGFINEMKLIADKMKLDIFKILDASETKSFGFKRFDPGPGIGGHCIPIDPLYLYWKANELGIKANFIKLASDTNLKIIKFIENKILKVIQKKKIKKNQSKILILGLAYKKNIDDLRESASIRLIKTLNKKNIKNVYFSEPHIKKTTVIPNFKLNKKNIKITPINLRKFDVTVLMTDHDIFDYDLIYKNSKIIIDTRGRYNSDEDKIIRG